MAEVTRFACRVGIAAVLTMLVGCSGKPTGPEAELRAWIDAVHEAAEAKDRGEIVDRISASYVDGRGNSRDDIEDMLRLYFLRQGTVEFIPSPAEITVIGGTAAEISLTVAMAGTNSGLRGISADAYRFELELEDDGSDWKLISARWGELGGRLR